MKNSLLRQITFILFMCAALLAGGAALAAPGEADVTVSDQRLNVPEQDTAIANLTGKADVSVSDGRLSVSAQDAAIGNIISEISQQAGFELDMNPEVSGKTVTTSFSDLDIQKGIERLLALIRHKDYFIYYGTDGSISRLEVHGSEEGDRPAVQRQGTPPSRFVPPNNRRRVPPRQRIRQTPPVPNRSNTPQPGIQFTPSGAPVPPPTVNQPGMPPMPVNPIEEPTPPDIPMDDVPEDMPTPPALDNSGSTPYIPPARMPSYIPPRH